MTDTPSARFADYATSGAFAIGLTRGQIATLALIAGGDHNPAPHMATIGALERKGLARVIDGGESGPNARPMHPDWARSLRDQCVAVGVAFHFKQWGEWGPLETTADRKGKIRDKTQRAQWHDAVGLIIDTPAAEDGLTFFSEGQVFRVGKHHAGRLLDGRTWDQMPGVAHG